MGIDSNFYFTAGWPSITFNSNESEYMVTWSGDNTLGIDYGISEREIYAQRIQASSGNLIGTSPLRVSDMGPNLDEAYGATSNALAYSPAQGHYLSVWTGDDNTAPQTDNELEIWGQLIVNCQPPVALCQNTTMNLPLDLSLIHI